jgi:hypothetical protein
MQARDVLTLNREIMDPSMAPPITEDAITPRWLKLARRLLFPSLTDIIFIFIIILAFLVPADGWQRLLADGDTGLHIRVGDAILAGRHVPTQDLFSFSRPGQEWFAFEWLSEVIFSILHGLFGLKGVVLFSGVLLAATFTSLLRYLLWLGANSLIALALVLMAINTSLIHFLARPHLFTLLLTVVFMWLIAADRRRKSFRIWLLVPLTVLWTNLHGGFPVGFALLGLLVAGSALEGWLRGELRPYCRSEAVRYASVGFACVSASLINPYGVNLHRHVFQVVRADWIRSLVDEFKSPSFRSEQMLLFMALLFLGLIVVAPLVQKGKITDALWILFLAYCSLVSVRHVPLFALVSVPIVAVEISAWWTGWTRTRTRRSLAAVIDELTQQIRVYFGSVSLCPLIFITAISLPGSVQWPKDLSVENCPANLIARHAKQIAGSRLFTSDQWADYLVYHFYPRQRVFIDGRHNFYGERIATDYLKLIDGRPGWKELLAHYGFDLVLCQADWPLASLLRTDSHWRIVDTDGKAIVFERSDRNSGGAAGGAERLQ